MARGGLALEERRTVVSKVLLSCPYPLFTCLSQPLSAPHTEAQGTITNHRLLKSLASFPSPFAPLFAKPRHATPSIMMVMMTTTRKHASTNSFHHTSTLTLQDQSPTCSSQNHGSFQKRRRLPGVPPPRRRGQCLCPATRPLLPPPAAAAPALELRAATPADGRAVTHVQGRGRDGAQASQA